MNSTNFTDAFLTSGLDKKTAAELLKDIKKNKEFNDRCDYVIDTIHINENGDFSFLTEKRKIEVKHTQFWKRWQHQPDIDFVQRKQIYFSENVWFGGPES